MGPAEYPTPGIYLTFQDGERLVLDHAQVEQYAECFLNDPAKVPEFVKQAADFQPCDICPQRDSGEFCHALRPVLPFFDVIDRYASHDPVHLAYYSPDNTVYSAETTVQQALRSISLASLMFYCEMGKGYWKYFYGVHPIMRATEAVVRVYLNIYYIFRGDRGKVKELVRRFRDDISVTSACQIKRLRLICKKDAFLNAFAKTQVIAEILALDPESLLDIAIQEFASRPGL